MNSTKRLKANMISNYNKLTNKQISYGPKHKMNQKK